MDVVRGIQGDLLVQAYGTDLCQSVAVHGIYSCVGSDGISCGCGQEGQFVEIDTFVMINKRVLSPLVPTPPTLLLLCDNCTGERVGQGKIF